MNEMFVLAITCYVLMTSLVCCSRSFRLLALRIDLTKFTFNSNTGFTRKGENINTCRLSKQINFLL